MAEALKIGYGSVRTINPAIAPRVPSPKFGTYHRLKPVRSPLNYIGGKYKLLDQITPLLPKQIDRFVDLFAGGCNVAANVEAQRITCNDNLSYLVELYKHLQQHPTTDILTHIERRIEQYNLSLTNEEGYKALRQLYNTQRHHLDLFVLVAYSFNHQIRFNNNHQFNNPFGRLRSSFNQSMRNNLVAFVERIQGLNIEFTSTDFVEVNLEGLGANDFVYCDPPYLITTGTYNDGKRGFTGWGTKEELGLLALLDGLDQKGVKFALSNVLEHKGQSNDLLKAWVEQKHYTVNPLAMNYANSSYHTLNRDKQSSVEVLVTNYRPSVAVQKTLF